MNNYYQQLVGGHSNAFSLKQRTCRFTWYWLLRSKSHCFDYSNEEYMVCFHFVLELWSNFPILHKYKRAKHTPHRHAGVRATKRCLTCRALCRMFEWIFFYCHVCHCDCVNRFIHVLRMVHATRWMSGIWYERSFFNSNSFWILLEWNFPNALYDMTCVIARRNIRRHFLPSRFEMIKSIIWQLQIEFYMLNKLTYWRVTIYQPFIILMNSLENHVHLIDKCMPVWRVFEIHKNADFTWKWAVGRFCTACFSKE